MANNIRRKIKNLDLFGHPVSFNLNEKGDTFTTLPGGICSLLFYMFIFIFSIATLGSMTFSVKNGTPNQISYSLAPNASNVKSKTFYMFQSMNGIILTAYDLKKKV